MGVSVGIAFEVKNIYSTITFVGPPGRVSTGELHAFYRLLNVRRSTDLLDFCVGTMVAYGYTKRANL